MTNTQTRSSAFIHNSNFPEELKQRLLALLPVMSDADYFEAQNQVMYYDQQLNKIKRGEFRLTADDINYAKRRAQVLASEKGKQISFSS